MPKTALLFEKIDALVDELIFSSDDASVLSSSRPARKMLALFMSLKKPFEKRILETFAAGHDDTITKLLTDLFKSKTSLPYFQSMISLSYFYWNWIRQYKLKLSPQQIDELTLSLIYGAIGYKLLDTFCDDSTATSDKNLISNAQMLYISKYLIAHQEATLARHFNNAILFANVQGKYNRLFCDFGIRELACKYKSSPIDAADSIHLGYKSAPLMLYFALGLGACGQEQRIPDYERIFFLTTSSIQIHDDIFDAMDDLLHGNITLITRDFVDTIDYAGLIKQPEELKKAFARFLETTGADIALFKIAQANLEEALEICHQYSDNIFELFIESKLLGVLEKINRREALHEESQRQKSAAHHQGKDR